MSEAHRNLEEVTELAMKTGEAIVELECPCCGKSFYALESEANYQYDDYAKSQLKRLGRKCPFCGFFKGGNVSGDQLADARERMKVEMEAEQMAQEAADKRQAPWSEINNMGLQFGDPKDGE